MHASLISIQPTEELELGGHDQNPAPLQRPAAVRGRG
jgi:hypothetical protein